MILTHGSNSISRGGSHQNEVEIGGRWYPYVQIGNQIWMAENLDYKFDVNGSTLPIGSAGTPTTPAAWYYDNNEASYGIDGTYKCGLLYNWYAAKYLNDNRDTLLPSGWHVPTSSEFDTLATNVGGASTAGTKLKALNNSVTSNWPSGWNGTDDYGFNALPAGYYYGIFYSVNSTSYLWTTEQVSSYAYFRQLNAGPSVSSSYDSKDYGYSIRLVKNAI